MQLEYSIKDLEKISGIKAHTIRIWEQRYQLLQPERSETNIRHYTDAQLKRLLDIALLQKNGFKLTRISKFTDSEFLERIQQIYTQQQETNDSEPYIQRCIKAMLNLDEREFQQTLQQASTHKDFGTIVIEILFPFLRRVGMLWNLSEISPGHEHFISNLIKRNIHTAIQLLPNPAQQSPQYILYLVETELHEIGLLFAAYLLRQKGYRVLYLGQSVPIKSLESVLTQHNDTLLLTSVSTLQPLELFRQHLQKLSNYPHTILVACHPSIADKLKLVGNAHHIQLSEYFSQLPDYS